MPPRSSKSVDVAVKSSMRTLEILEYCDSVQRGVTISELVAKLDYPQSSTSVLVQSLINAGYLIHDTDGRTVMPTSRVALLGRWVDQPISRPDIKRFMQAMGEQTGLTVVLGVPYNIFVRYIDVVPGRQAMRLEIPVSTKLPMVASGMGHLLLSAMSDDAIAREHRRVTEVLKRQGKKGVRASDIADLWNENPVIPPLDLLMAEMQKIRKQGYSFSVETVTAGAGIISVLLPAIPGEPPMGMGLAGLSSRVSGTQDEILELLQRESRTLGITLALAT